jgi:tetratricopeptide (TPR) repeat protein
MPGFFDEMFAAVARMPLLIRRTEQLVQQGDYEQAVTQVAQVCAEARAGRLSAIDWMQLISLATGLCEAVCKALGDNHPLTALCRLNAASIHRGTGNAEPLYRQAVEFYRAHPGKEPRHLTLALDGLAETYANMGRFAEAAALCRESLDHCRSLFGERHLNLVPGLHNLARLHQTLGEYADAEALYKQALDIRQPALGKHHADVADSLDSLADLYQARGNLAAAEPLRQQSAEARRVALGEFHPGFAYSLNNLAELYRTLGNYAAAEPLYRRAEQIYRKALGDKHPHLATTLNNLALLRHAKGNYAAAEVLHQQALEMRRATVGEKHPDFAQSLNNLALLHQAKGEFAAAEPLLRQALDVCREALGEKHPHVATCLNNLAGLLQTKGDSAAAELLVRQALDLVRDTRGERHLDYAVGLHNLAQCHALAGDRAAAETADRQALDILRATLGEQHPFTAGCLDHLGELAAERGDYPTAQAQYRQALAVRRAALGENHPDVGGSLLRLAKLHQHTGDPAVAEVLTRQALTLYQAALGPNHPRIALCLDNLAWVYRARGRLAEAEAPLRQALAARRAALGDRHPEVATSLSNLALWHEAQGDYAAAEPLHRQAVELARGGGENQTTFVLALHGLAMWHYKTGDRAAAEPLLRQTLEAGRAALGFDHPHVATFLSNLAALTAASDRHEDALQLLLQAAAIHEHTLGQVFAIGSERQRASFCWSIQGHLDAVLSLVAQHLAQAPAAVAAALDLVLRRKALGFEALAAQREAGRDPELEPRLRALAALRMQIARKTLAGPGPDGVAAHRKALARWHVERERLEAELAGRVPEIGLQRQLRAADRQAVARALPEGSALVEFVRVGVFDFHAVPTRGEAGARPARYLAFVLAAGDPDAVRLIDLGDAGLIDRLIAAFRAGILGRAEARPGETPPGAALRIALFEPLAETLGGRRRLLLAPDGDLTWLPWEVLPTADGRRLLDDYAFSYVGVGRDVLRFAGQPAGQPTPPLVVADPAFELEAAPEPVAPPPRPGFWSRLFSRSRPGSPAEEPDRTALAPGRRSRDFSRSLSPFSRLPGTRVEGERVAALLGVQPWLDDTALEGRLKAECRSPRILHLATHGFFLPDQGRAAAESPAAFSGPAAGEPERLSGAGLENPLLRSGLALAGANTWLRRGRLPAEAEDGLLTAEDVTGLDLRDTELVVLSACQSGVGEVHTGEGVFGLRRAFALAGARTLLVSLWSVPDEPTRELMEDFYRRVLAGEPRAAALRRAQQGLKAKYADPLCWGAFICQGNPGPLSTPLTGRKG